MTYRAVLVHVPLGNADVQVELAASLAKENGAHLTGICSLVEVGLLKNAMQNPFLRLEPTRVEELISRARQKGMVEVVVLADTPWTSAVALYQACGFDEVRRDRTDTHFAIRL